MNNLFSFKSLLILLMLAALAAPALADRSFSSLEERMTGREFRETGLYKLSDEELAALNQWIRQRSLAELDPSDTASSAAASIPEDTRGLRQISTPRNAIESRIVGSFTGWRGTTEFELENGMVWRQAEPGTFVIPAVDNPEVRIRPTLGGTWRMRVEGYNSQVRVERIR